MWPFKKKVNEKDNSVEIEFKVPHEHTWKDMPWYMITEYSESKQTASYQIIEPYICITCGERKDVKLESTQWNGITVEERKKFFQEVKDKYKDYLKPRAVVEDMINNILLVKDPEYLDTVEAMRGTPHRRCGTSAEMKRVIDESKNNIGNLFVPKEIKE